MLFKKEGTLETKAEELKDISEDLMKSYMEMLGGFTSLAEMDDNTAILLKNSFKLYEMALEYSIMVSKELDRIEQIEAKIDKLLAKK